MPHILLAGDFAFLAQAPILAVDLLPMKVKKNMTADANSGQRQLKQASAGGTLTTIQRKKLGYGPLDRVLAVHEHGVLPADARVRRELGTDLKNVELFMSIQPLAEIAQS